MRRIIIVGYMGAGKTTVGKALAKELGMQFYDLDWYIEGRMRKTVPQLFAERGEDGFREIAPEVLCAHLKMGKTRRPLLEGKDKDELLDFVTGQLARREGYYAKAKHTLDVNLLDNYEKIKVSVERLREILGI